MNLSERNRKVALSRWKNNLKITQENIYHGKDSEVIKSTLCGFLAGDGSVQVRKEKSFSHYQLDFFPDDELMLKEYLKLMKKIYKVKPSIRRRSNVYVARTSQKFVVLDLLKLSKFGLYTWNIPEWILINDLNKRAWLKAFFSAEGYVNKKYIKTQSVNIESIKEVKNMLSSLGIKGNYYEYIPKNLNHSKVGMIFINEKRSRLIYYKEIGFLHSKKTKKLKESLGL